MKRFNYNVFQIKVIDSDDFVRISCLEVYL